MDLKLTTVRQAAPSADANNVDWAQEKSLLVAAERASLREGYVLPIGNSRLDLKLGDPPQIKHI